MTRRALRTTDTNEFVELVRTTLVWKLRASHRMSKHDAEDAASAAIIRLVPKVATVVEAYPSAQAYAFAVARSAAEDFHRSQRGQRGEGARLVTGDTDPSKQRTKRTVVQYDTEFERHAHPVNLEHDVTTSVDVQALLSHLKPADRWLVWAIAVGGYSVVEAARALGISREHAGRKYKALTIRLRTQHAQPAEAA